MHVEDSKEASAARKQFVERRVSSESTAGSRSPLVGNDTPNVGTCLTASKKKISPSSDIGSIASALYCETVNEVYRLLGV